MPIKLGEVLKSTHKSTHKSTLAAAFTVAGLTALAPAIIPGAFAQDAVSFGEIGPIIAERCTVCHSVSPTQPGYLSPPNDIIFDTPEQIQALAAKIKLMAVEIKVMPLFNETNMTDGERNLLAAWLEAGADITR